MDPTQHPILPTHEPQRQRLRSALHPVSSIRLNRNFVSTQLTNLKHWFTDTWLDWLTLIITGCICAGVWVAPSAFTRYVPITFSTSGDIVFPSLAYPYVEPIFSSLAAGILCIAIPILVILLSQLWIQSFLDFANGTLGLLYSVATGTCFQVILKKTIGGFRPHFLSVCQPVIPPGVSGSGFQNVMFTVDQICTGNQHEINNAIQSFPSGHSNIAFAGLGYLAIYLFTHLQIRGLSRRRPSHWRMIFVVLPVLFATYIACTLVLGYHHHAYDVIFGSLIGISMAFFGYRMVFASIWDPKWNAVPLVRNGRESQQTTDKTPLDGQLNGGPVGNAVGDTDGAGTSDGDTGGAERRDGSPV